MKVLIIEDDKDLAQMLKATLKGHFVVEAASSGEEGEYLAHIGVFDLVILDVMLPDANGIDVCRRMRMDRIAAPILILNGETKCEEKLRAFASGADDYLIKPFQFDELLARVRALLRRYKNFPSDTISLVDLTIDVSKKCVFRSAQAIPLRKKEYLILEYLMRNIGKVITRETLINHVWEISEETTGNVIDVHIKYLRDRVDRKFDHKNIKTVQGLCYKK
jgi:DNA-binding response OmpR family regulator